MFFTTEKSINIYILTNKHVCYCTTCRFILTIWWCVWPTIMYIAQTSSWGKPRVLKCRRQCMLNVYSNLHWSNKTAPINIPRVLKQLSLNWTVDHNSRRRQLTVMTIHSWIVIEFPKTKYFILTLLPVAHDCLRTWNTEMRSMHCAFKACVCTMTQVDPGPTRVSA